MSHLALVSYVHERAARSSTLLAGLQQALAAGGRPDLARLAELARTDAEEALRAVRAARALHRSRVDQKIHHHLRALDSTHPTRCRAIARLVAAR